MEYLKSFSEKYECLGRTTPDSYVEFLRKCLLWLPEQTHLCLILGATKVFEGDKGKRQRHERLNEAIKLFSKEHQRLQYIEVDDCVHDASDFTDSINHFSTRVYYEIAQAMIRIIEQSTGRQMESYSSSMVAVDGLIQKIRKSIKCIVKPDGRLYDKLKQVYYKIYKNRK